MRKCWVILTGSYPPAPGGVGDYTRVVAGALAAAGDEVHVVTSAGGDDESGVRVHRVAGYGVPDIGALADVIDRLPAHRELLVQYTPYAFAPRAGAAVALPLWLRARSRRERITVMFHEVMHAVRPGQPLRLNLRGRAQRWMARVVVSGARRALVATPRWAQILRNSCGATCPIEWAPVPSNLPTCAELARVAATRAQFTQPGELLVGHFGTYSPWIAELLEPIVLSLRLRVLLVGHGSSKFRMRLIVRCPSDQHRILASGALDADDAAAHLAACDVLVQPYPDGVTTRRSSVMAGLALGVPTVTNAGELTERLWEESGAVALARGPDPSSIIRCADTLAGDASRRAELSQRAVQLYRERFCVERTVEILRRR
jgi:glycosyltransferase involved in cell wall biosynthesis